MNLDLVPFVVAETLVSNSLSKADKCRYAWEPHRGGNWAALVAAGLPFGLGAFTLFLSTITYLVDMYQSGAAASGKGNMLEFVTTD